MSRIVDHINQVPDVGDLMFDQPETQRWLPTPVTPVLATPAALVVAVAWAALNGAAAGGCITPGGMSPDRPPSCN